MSSRLARMLQVGCVAIVVVVAAPRSARAQEAGAVAATAAAAAPGSTRGGTGFFGRDPERRRLIPTIWRTHPFDNNFPELAYTRGVALQASGWLAAAFINSYDRFSMLAGMERAWVEARTGSFAIGTGYRAGLISGYDERLLSWADHTPVLPFVGLLAWVQLGRVSLDGFYVYRAITLEGSVTF
jgi:hypothetical protein